MATQSADVERCCKVHKVVHSKSRNRLKNANVTKLIYCYVNLRLLKKLEAETGSEEVLDSNNDLEDFLGSAIFDDDDEPR